MLCTPEGLKTKLEMEAEHELDFSSLKHKRSAWEMKKW